MNENEPSDPKIINFEQRKQELSEERKILFGMIRNRIQVLEEIRSRLFQKPSGERDTGKDLDAVHNISGLNEHIAIGYKLANDKNPDEKAVMKWLSTEWKEDE